MTANMKEGERIVRVWQNPFSKKLEILLSTPYPNAPYIEWWGAIGIIEDDQVKWVENAERRFEITNITAEQIMEDLATLAAATRRQIREPKFPRQLT